MKPDLRRVTATLLVLAMLFSTVACKKTKKTNSVVVKESDPYFDVQEIELKPDLGPDDLYCSLQTSAFSGDYIVAEYYWQKKYPAELTVRFHNAEESGDEEEYNAVSAELNKYFTSGIGIFDMNGKLMSRIELPEDETLVGVFTGYNNEIMLVINEFRDEVIEEDYNVVYSTLHLCEYSPQGEKLRDIPLLGESTSLEMHNIVFLEDGTFLFLTNENLFCFDLEGNLRWMLFGEEERHYDLYHQAHEIFFFKGEWYICEYDYSGEFELSDAHLRKLDLKEHKLGQEKIQINVSGFGFQNYGEMIYNTDLSGLYSEDPITGTREELINWNSVDYNYKTFESQDFRIISENEYLTLVSGVSETVAKDELGFSSHYFVQKLLRLTRAPKNPHAGKQLITIGLCSIDADAFVDYIVRYNTMEGGSVRIGIKYYYETKSGSELWTYKAKELYDRVYQEMISGTGPDILMGFSDYEQFNSEKLLVDLNTYIDGKNGLDRNEYFDNVFRAFEVKEKMYQIPVCIDIAGYAANGKMIGQRTGWTCPEFDQVVSKIPDKVAVLDRTPCIDLLDTILSNCMSSFIDYDKKEVYFDNEEFKQVLNISRKYGIKEQTEPDPENDPIAMDPVDDYYNMITDPLEKLDQGKVAMVEVYIYSLQQFVNTRNCCDGQAVFVGFPSTDGSGMSARPRMTLGISASSQYKDQAWDFIRFMFNYDEQITYSQEFYSVPLSRRAFQKINSDAIESSDTAYDYFMENFGETDPGWLRMTEEDSDDFTKLMENVSTIYSTDLEIMEVIDAESEKYFEGKKDIEQVVADIQAAATKIIKERS